MHWPFSNNERRPTYELAFDDDVRTALARWKRYFYILSGLYFITASIGLGERFLLDKHPETSQALLKSDLFFPESTSNPHHTSCSKLRTKLLI
jgi:hypothetical protein